MFFSPHVSSPALRLTQPPAQWVPGWLPEGNTAGLRRRTNTPIHRRVSKWVELYVYSPSVRTWHVTGKPLPFPNYQHTYTYKTLSAPHFIYCFLFI
jgi:hypothetical protein